MTGPTTLPAPGTDPVVLEETRRRVEQLVCDLPGGDPAEMAFEHPWEIRAFAMAVAAHHEVKFDWSEFQRSLIASIREWETTGADAGDRPWSYYEHWVAALESVLTGTGVLDAATLDEQTREVLDLPPNRNHHEAHTEPIAIDPARTVHA